MLNKKASCWTILYATLSVLIICFIFGNSLKDGTESSLQSARVAEILRQILDPGRKIEEGLFHFYVRKAAHFTEFAALGCCLNGTAVSLRKQRNHLDFLKPLFIAVSVAMTDEFIQRFTGRTSSVRDVMLDSLGALFGILVVSVSVFLWRKRDNSGNNQLELP